MGQYRRAIIMMMDSVGIGAAPDAASYYNGSTPDVGANTLLHVMQHCQTQRQRPLHIPNLVRLGIVDALIAAASHAPQAATEGDVYGTLAPALRQLAKSFSPAPGIFAAAGSAIEISSGKDTPSGHWEMAGVPVTTAWGLFPDQPKCFPSDIIEKLITAFDLPGVLGECHASGTEIIRNLGEAHMHTGAPIVYTSADSVFQIAAHEETFGLQRLYDLCAYARTVLDPYHIGRVIARPFCGADADSFQRTGNRKDYAVSPPAPTLLDYVTAYRKESAIGQVVSIGKMGDIYAHRGTGTEIKATGNMALFDATLEAMQATHHRTAPTLILTNFVDFDQSFGHRRNPGGYATALEDFDARLPEFFAQLHDGDLVVFTADHGCDPTWVGTDHTREQVPMVFAGASVARGAIAPVTGFFHMGQTLADWLRLENMAVAHSLLGDIVREECY